MNDEANNFVPFPPQGMIVAIQYWQGDEGRAMRLARLLADIELEPRDDVTIAFVRRFDVPETALLYETRLQVGFKFGTMVVRARREGKLYPHGCNELWSSCMEQFSESWRAGRLSAHSVATFEADNVPLRTDWLNRLLEAHRDTLKAGKRITGPMMQEIPHINGSLIAHLSLWFDRPSLHRTPSDQGWDLFHEHVIQGEALATPWIKNIYGSCRWSRESLFAMSHETAWLASQKDDSAIEWAEQSLVASAQLARKKRGHGCFCPLPKSCRKGRCPCTCDRCARRK